MNSLIKIVSIVMLFATNSFPSALQETEKYSFEKQKEYVQKYEENLENIHFKRPTEKIMTPSKEYYLANRDSFRSAYESLKNSQLDNDNKNIIIAISGLNFLYSVYKVDDIKHFISYLNEFLNLKLLFEKQRLIERCNRKSVELGGEKFFSIENFRDFLNRLSNRLEDISAEQSIVENILGFHKMIKS